MGFYVRVDGNFLGPHDKLSDARSEARSIGPNVPIYHGDLVIQENGEVDLSQLAFIPKPEIKENS